MENKIELSQPKSLKFLFLSESVQRFSLYGIQSILMFFLLHSLSYSTESAYTTYGIFTALSFILAILGGVLADRWLGFRRVVFIGITLSLIGNIILSLNIEALLMVGLAFVLCGFGLFLPNNSSLLGSFYSKNDHRRSRGFTIFYIGTNIGGLLGPVIYGILSTYGWHISFIVSGLFLISLVIFYLKFITYFKGYGSRPISTERRARLYNFLAYLSILLLLAGVIFMLKNPSFGVIIITILGALSLGLIILYGLSRERQERKKVFYLIGMILCTLIFFSSVFQIYTSLLMFIEQYVNREFIRWIIPSSVFTSLEPLFIVMLAPAIAYVWKRLGNKNKEPLPFIKISYGLLFGGFGFFVFALGAHHAAYNNGENISMLWIIVGNLLLGVGELFIMPTLISAITQYAPKTVKSTMMGLLYLALAFSGYFSSLIGKLTINDGRYSTSIIYFDVYIKIFLLTTVIALALLIAAYSLKRSGALILSIVE